MPYLGLLLLISCLWACSSQAPVAGNAPQPSASVSGSPAPDSLPDDQVLNPFYLPRLGYRDLLATGEAQDTAPLPSEAEPAPRPTATADISTIERSTFSGQVLDDAGRPMNGVLVQVRSLNRSVVFTAETLTVEGSYHFSNAPAGIQLEIIISAPGYATRRRVEVLKSNKQGDPQANHYDFGGGTTSTPSPTPQASATGTLPSYAPAPAPLTPVGASAPAYFYYRAPGSGLSVDGSASLGLLQRILNQLNQNRRPPLTLVRPWDVLALEALPAESPVSLGPLRLEMGLRTQTLASGATVHDWAARLAVPALTREERSNTHLIVLLEQNDLLQQTRLPGAASAPVPLLDVIAQGLETLDTELKNGDLVSLVRFGAEAQVLLEGQAFSGTQALSEALAAAPALAPGHDLPQGLQTAYQLAQQYVQPGRGTRVLLLGTGLVPDTLQADMLEAEALVSSQAEQGTGLSVIACGLQLHEQRLHQLSSLGRGALLRLESAVDVPRVFGTLLPGLLAPAVRQLAVQLESPTGLNLLSSSSESSAAQGLRWQSALLPGAQQGFWQRYDGAALSDTAVFRLRLRYTDAQNQSQERVYERSVAQLRQQYQSGVNDVRLIAMLYQGLRQELSPAQAQQELDGHLQGHQTPLAQRYRPLIQQWRNLP
ncbi:MAG: carboxypeptidase regulatory-like domain-containing protein [Candidatus Sericytochromatia bacterium]|nr:carboxypeptidase regulatory-like domain-containing protein [Candidatus Sericytochromatia bacterium]